MAEHPEVIRAGRDRQRLNDGAVHGWYQFVLGYPDHLIQQMLDLFGVSVDSIILDPFCGTGTTLVECKKLGLASVGIDANPASAFASRVKTNWTVDPAALEQLSHEVLNEVDPVADELLLSDTPLFARNGQLDTLKSSLLRDSIEGRYIAESGMLDRHWIDEAPFYISIALLSCIKRLDAEPDLVDLLRLALASCIVEKVANVRFGPEIYVVKDSGTHDVVGAFRSKVRGIAEDLARVQDIECTGSTLVLEGDSRNCDELLRSAGIPRIDHVITSPPYPTEKDYTRNTRLELVHLGFVHDRDSLRRIKAQMIRSHSKGIYKSDADGRLVAELPYVKALADELRRKVKGKTYGFAKLYPRIIEEYFGGMYRHLIALSRVMRRGGKAAYVVGEQCTYLQTFTPTGTILAKLAERPEVGFRLEDILVWRVRQGTTGSGNSIKEEIVIIERA